MDQYNDPCNEKLVKLASQIKLPSRIFTKDLYETNVDTLSKNAFAMPFERLFPIHTPEDTLLSGAFFLNKTASFENDEEIFEKISSAAFAHGIEEEFSDMVAEIQENKLLKEASPQREYILDDIIDGERITAFPSSSVEELEKSARAFEEQTDILGPVWSRKVARRLAKKAEYFSVDLNSSLVDSYTMERDIDLEKAASYMIFRAKRAPNQGLRTMMVKAAQGMLANDLSETNFEKLATFIDNFDQVAKTHVLVSKGTLPDGYNSIFNRDIIIKSAGITLDGKEYSEKDFKSLPLDKYAEALGKEFIKASSDRNGNFSVDQAMNIASTLPLPDAKVLSSYLDGTK